MNQNIISVENINIINENKKKSPKSTPGFKSNNPLKTVLPNNKMIQKNCNKIGLNQDKKK